MVSFIIKIIFLLTLFIQVGLVGIFASKTKSLRRKTNQTNNLSIKKWPQAEVILCIRGLDTTLDKLIKTLASQSYPGEWHLQIIIDSEKDASWQKICTMIETQKNREDASANWKKINIEPLKIKSNKGSLKCASLLQAFNRLDPETSVIAFVDSDANIDNNWLRVLVQGCCQEGIGAASGNRWYIPKKNTLSAWSRAVWNAGALVMMTVLEIPWGGSLCVKREVIDEGIWRENLEYSLCEDTSLIKALRVMGLKYFFIPDLLIVDETSTIGFKDLTNWLTRQLLTVRLHHHAWPLICIHGLSTSFILFIGILNKSWISLFFYEFGCIGLLVWIESIALKKSNHSIKNWAVALLAGQVVNGIATFKASIARSTEWRGVNYRLTQKPRGVEMMQPSSSSEAIS